MYAVKQRPFETKFVLVLLDVTQFSAFLCREEGGCSSTTFQVGILFRLEVTESYGFNSVTGHKFLV